MMYVGTILCVRDVANKIDRNTIFYVVYALERVGWNLGIIYTTRCTLERGNAWEDGNNVTGFPQDVPEDY